MIGYGNKAEVNKVGIMQGSFWVCAQPMKDDFTM